MAKKYAVKRRWHKALNDLTRAQVAAIVRQSYPGVRASKVDKLAKEIIAGAHRVISPRKVSSDLH